MKRVHLLALLLPLLLSGCGGNQTSTPSSSISEEFNSHTIEHPRKSGEIGAFNLLSPENGFVTDKGVTFVWEDADNCDSYQLEIASTLNFISDDEDEVYVRERNIESTSFTLNYTLQKKDILYYWRVTALNKDHTKKCNEAGNFFYQAAKVDELPIKIEDSQDWVVHKEGSQAEVSIDRNDFFGTGNDSLVIKFDKEHTNQGIPSSDGWIVITKQEDRELYGTDAFYFNFYYSGHDATVLVRVLDYDGEYWHKQVQISNNSKQTILVRYQDFELRTAGTNIFNRRFDWEHIRYFEIVFERTFGDGICIFSNIKAVKFADYSDMFIQKLDFRISDKDTWTYENYNFDKTISEDGSELTLGYKSSSDSTSNPFNGFGFQNVHVYRYLVQGDAIRMKVKYTGTGSNAVFYFRVLEEDNDRWQFKTPFTYFVKNEYKELVIPLKALQRTDYMTGDGAKQFYYIQKFNFGLADNYSTGTLSIKDFEVINIDDIVESRVKEVTSDGCIEDFNNYDLYTQIYYFWEQSSVNKDEAMKLDSAHKVGGTSNPYCAEFDYKADMEMATYQLFMDTSKVNIEANAFSIWLKDATPKNDSQTFKYLSDEDVAAEMTIQLTMSSGEWYRYVIDKVGKEWNKYTIKFSDFTLVNGDSMFDEPQPLSVDKIMHLAFGFKYLYYDQNGNHVPTYAIANPVYLDEMYFTLADKTSIDPIPGTIYTDPDGEFITVETMESYSSTEEIFENWAYNTQLDYNEMSLSDDVSVKGGNHSIKMHYRGATSVSYARSTLFAQSVKAQGFQIDVKGDGKASMYLNLNWRVGTTLYKMRYELKVRMYNADQWRHYEIGLQLFKDVNGSQKTLTQDSIKGIESISFGIVNNDYSESDLYVDNIGFIVDYDYEGYSTSIIK